jgi:hypothetical protein
MSLTDVPGSGQALVIYFARSKEKEEMQKVQFDPSRWPALVADLEALVKTGTPFAAAAYQAFADLTAMLKGAPVVMASAPVKCGPDGGCTDAATCCDAVVKAQVQALALAIQMQSCCCPD